MKLTQEQQKYISDRNQKIADFAKQGVSPSDLAITFELSEPEIRSVLRGAGVTKKKCRLNLEKASIGTIDTLLDRIREMRLKGFSQSHMAKVLKLRLLDVKAIVEEFKIPYGFRCVDCDTQIILKFPLVIQQKERCPDCKKKLRNTLNVKYTLKRYHADPKFKEKVKANARKYSKQPKILG